MIKKIFSTLTALILMLTMTLSLVALPTEAQVTRVTYAYIGATPNPVGVGQETLLHVGITHPTAWPQAGWVGLTITVTRPDGTNETLGPFNTDPTGGTGTIYIPTSIGNYSLQTHFPEQTITTAAYGTPANATMLASNSPVLTLVVQEDPITEHPGYPLPTEFWSRPVNAQFREWNIIAGNWLAYARGSDVGPHSSVAPYTTGPESGHILWTKPLVLGGLAGGIEEGPHSYDHGDAYEGRWSPPVIIQGMLFYNRHQSDGGTRVEQEVVAVDLRTGEEIWVRNWNNTRLSHGQVFYYDNFNQHSVYAYLWTTVGSTWNAFDPLTGRWVYGMNNVPAGVNVYAPNGEIHRYTVNLAGATMTLWNTSKVVENHRRQALGDGYDIDPARGSWIRQYIGLTLNGSLGIEWNISIPTGLPGAVRKVRENVILGADFHRGIVAPSPAAIWAISAAPGNEGQLLFNTTWTPPQDSHASIEDASYTDGVFNVAVQETTQQFMFSLTTGELLWGPSEHQRYQDQYGYASGNRWDVIHDGKLFAGNWGGTLYAYDVHTGQLLWTYDAYDENNEILWGNNWPIRIAFIADGKIYLEHTEHSPVDPLPRGAPFIAVDTETGEEVFKVNIRGTEWGATPAIADGIITMFNSYDNRIYAIGRGPTAIRLSAVHGGSAVSITGTVMDISAGTRQDEVAARFPNGVPAVADENMNEWMQYVYMQFPRPADVSGVQITLSVIDSNGNSNDIGTITSDSNGNFMHSWSPEITGPHTIIATFTGSASYWPSHTQAVLAIGENNNNNNNGPAQPPAADSYFIPAVIAIILAIAIVGALIMMMLRRRP
jgi:outer membrane protein assembly factor BamB